MAVGSAMGVGAHHSVATVYDESRTMTLEGEIGRFPNHQPHLRMLTLRRPPDGLSLWSEQRLTCAACAW